MIRIAIQGIAGCFHETAARNHFPGEELQVVYLDVYAALVDSNGDLNAAYTDDGLHLLGEGYQVWKEAIRPYVK